MLNIMPPPTLQGDEQQQLTQVYRYLFRLSEQLNAVSMTLDTQASNASVAIAKAAGVELNSGNAEEHANHYTALVSLIVKTADIVQAKMDKVVTTLKSEYRAESEYGELTEEIIREIEETAKKTLENFIYDAKVTSLTPDEESEFDTHLEGFIVRGIIGFEEDGRTPIIGIAIGQNLLKKIDVVDGKKYEVIDTTTNLATYTANKLSFWINGIEVAYLSNSELYVTRIIVLDSIKLGGWDLAVNGKDDLTIRREIGGKLILESNEAITGLVGDVSGVASQLEQTAEAFELSLSKKVGEDTLRQYLRYENGTVEMGSSESRYKLQASNTGVVILQDGNPMTRMEQNTVAAPVFEAGRMLKIGDHAAKVSASGALVFN